MSTITERAGPRLHAALCQSAGLHEGEVGVQAELSRRLGIDKSRYARAIIQGTQVTLDKLLEWMETWNELGRGGRVSFRYDDDGEPRFVVEEVEVAVPTGTSEDLPAER